MANKVIDKCNIYKQTCQLILHEGEVECPWCRGHGGSFAALHAKYRHWDVRECTMCLGEGKIDWITNISKVPHAIHAKMKEVGIKCPSSRSKCKAMKRLWKQKKMKDDISMWQG